MAERPTKPFHLDDKVALVTGGAGGIGAGIAAVLSEAGAIVVIADRDEAGARRAAATLSEGGRRAGAVHVDLADEASIMQACAEVVSRYGAPWVLVNNAGVQDRELLLESTASEWDRTNAINARGPFLMTREIARAMAAGGHGGRIVNIGSAGLVGALVKGLAAYCASKGALLGLSRASAFELADLAITVNTV
jgi:NAD(P)-dependent dehydrogenase (short-subunit alcohol dehydrogenase family)